MVNQKRLVTEFLEMVKIDSPSGQERAMANVLKMKLEQLGCQVYEDNAGGQVGATAGNIIATLPGQGGGPMLMFSAHMDTVEPGRGIEPVINGDIITSAGDTVLGGDDKGGIAAILEAIRVVQEQDISHSGIEIVFTIWEEGGLRGAKSLDYGKIKSKFAYVLDSDGDPGTIIITAPTQNSIIATIKGKAAHAGQCPEDGINAIQVAAQAISEMKLGRIDHETTANIGIIKGGQATNIVPDSTYIAGEARSLDPDKLQAQTEHMCNILRQHTSATGAELLLEVEEQYQVINLHSDHPVVQFAVTAAKNLGLKPTLGSTGGGSDANIFNGQGLACANLGIGMNKVHTVEENIKISDLCKVAELVVEIIKVANQ